MRPIAFACALAALLVSTSVARSEDSSRRNSRRHAGVHQGTPFADAVRDCLDEGQGCLPRVTAAPVSRRGFQFRMTEDPPACIAALSPLRPGEAAAVILEVMESSGPSVLAGTTFEYPQHHACEHCISATCGGMQGAPCGRDEFIRWIRHLESQPSEEPAESAPFYQPLEAADAPSSRSFFESLPPGLAENSEGASPAVAPAEVMVLPVEDPRAQDRRAAVIATLRQAARQLEATANLLEERELYYRADEFRALAGQLREEGRSAGGGWSLEPLGTLIPPRAPRAERDLEREIEDLREELRRALEAQAPGPVRR